MKILHTVEFYSPSVGGAQEVVRNLSERMAATGHDVTVATTKLPERKTKTIQGVKIEEFEVSGNTVNGFRGPDIERYKAFLRESNFDVIMNYAAQEWTADLFFEVIGEVKGAKVFVPCGYSGLHDPAYQEYFEKLPDVLRKYDATVYLSKTYQDIAFAREHGLQNIRVIPNAADEREFGTLPKKEAAAFRRKHEVTGLLVSTIGNHTGEKGHRKSILAFFLAPFRNGTLAIIGREIHAGGCLADCEKLTRLVNQLSPLTGKKVLLLELERSETVAALTASDIFIFLSNIEASPLVLYEAAAVGVPFISSDAGNSREIAEWTGAGVIVDCYPGQLGRTRPKLLSTIRILTKLARDKELREKKGERGRRNWQEHFTWEKVTEQYLDLYRELAHK